MRTTGSRAEPSSARSRRAESRNKLGHEPEPVRRERQERTTPRTSSPGREARPDSFDARLRAEADNLAEHPTETAAPAKPVESPFVEPAGTEENTAAPVGLEWAAPFPMTGPSLVASHTTVEHFETAQIGATAPVDARGAAGDPSTRLMTRAIDAASHSSTEFVAETAPTVSAPPEPEVLDEAEEIARRWRVQFAPDHSTATLELRPHALGSVAIQLRWAAGGLEALVSAPRRAALESLRAREPELRAELERHGTSPARIEYVLAAQRENSAESGSRSATAARALVHALARERARDSLDTYA